MEEEKEENTRKPKAVVVGGSIAGISAAHSLLIAGWDVVVLEKTCAPPSGSPTGAGLGLDPLAQKIIESWIRQPNLLQNSTLPLTIDQQREETQVDMRDLEFSDGIAGKSFNKFNGVSLKMYNHNRQNQATDGEKKVSRILARDENFNFRAAYWADVYNLLYNALPSNIVLWGHFFLTFSVSSDKTCVTVKCKVLQTGDTIDIIGDLLIAADGCLSFIRQHFIPDLKLRYSGYCAWRGVLDFSDNENFETIADLKKAYPDLGTCLYFDLSSGTHCVFYELLNKRMNWIWYINQPEPEIKGNSVTMKVSSEMIEQMHKEAEKVWVPEFVRVIRKTKEPFLNVIYDCDPLHQITWDNVVMIGDAAHPTTPHGLRSTNMSVLDAAVLGECLEKWGVDKLNSALQEYQSIRVPVASEQVLYSRRLGRIKQGLDLSDRKPFDPSSTAAANQDDFEELKQKNMPFFTDVPSILI